MTAVLERVNKLGTQAIAGVKLTRRYDRSAPQAVRRRSSDNRLVTASLDRQPQVSLEAGLAEIYRWIHDRVAAGAHAFA